jgi:hypothetical protein
MKSSFSLSSIFSFAKQNVSIVLVAVLLILFVMEGWSLKQSWDVLSDSQNTNLVLPAKLVRVNFNTYDAIVRRVDNAAGYSPQLLIYRNPFGVNEKKPAQ